MGNPAFATMNNGEYGLLLISELAEMLEGMEQTCLQSIPETVEEDVKSWTKVGVLTAFSAVRQAFSYVQLTMAKGLEGKDEPN